MKFEVPPPVITQPTLNTQKGTLKSQALSGTETAAPEGPALGFLLSHEVRTPGPLRLPSGPRTQRRILRSSAAHPEFRGRPRRLPSSRKPQEAETVGAPEAQVTPKPSGVEAAPPWLRTRASVVLFSAPAISALGSQE